MKISLGNCANVLAKPIPVIRISDVNSTDFLCFNKVYQIALQQVVPVSSYALHPHVVMLGFPTSVPWVSAIAFKPLISESQDHC